MRTLSARILLGFAALTVTFGFITATVVINMQKVEEEIALVRDAYVPLALDSKQLARQQEALVTWLDNFEDTPVNVRYLPPVRDRLFVKLRTTLTKAELLPLRHRKEFEERLQRIEGLIADAVPLYAALISAKKDPKTGEVTYDKDALTKLRPVEGTIKQNTEQLQGALERAVTGVTARLEDNEHKLRIYTIYFGLTAVILGILMTIWVVITLRPLQRLRGAARSIAAGEYDKRIPERGPTEVKDLARELNSMARAVEERERELVRSERLAAVGKMSAMIAHEVRNPLSSIALNVELLEEELPSAGEAKQLCSSIHREVDRLAAITEEYLAFSRLPKPKVAKEPVNKIVDELAEFVREDLAVKNVKLGVELGSGDPVAMIDAAQIRQCLINLVRNATEAVNAKGGGHVTIRTEAKGERVLIEVEDDGTGIPADVLPRLFDTFFSTKESGSGLGLALTQQIVKDHGGDVTVESTVGRGTTFKVSVPAAV